MIPRKVLKKNKTRGTREPGFTLLEVLVSLVLLGIGLAFAAKVFVAGKYFIKETENKNRAMEIASGHMNKYLVNSYDGLKALLGSTADNVPFSVTPENEDGFTTEVTLTSKQLDKINSTSTPKDSIPFIKIDVVCNYKEPDINGRVADKSIQLNNIVVYPYIHIYTMSYAYKLGDSWKEYATTSSDNPIGNDSVNITLRTESDLLVFYDVSIGFDDTSGLEALDLIYTQAITCKCNEDFTNCNESEFPSPTSHLIQTGTPIMTQATISNTVSIPNLKGGNYKVGVIWWKSVDEGSIYVRKANLVVLQVEK